MSVLCLWRSYVASNVWVLLVSTPQMSVPPEVVTLLKVDFHPEVVVTLLEVEVAHKAVVAHTGNNVWWRAEVLGRP